MDDVLEIVPLLARVPLLLIFTTPLIDKSVPLPLATVKVPPELIFRVAPEATVMLSPDTLLVTVTVFPLCMVIEVAEFVGYAVGVYQFVPSCEPCHVETVAQSAEAFDLK